MSGYEGPRRPWADVIKFFKTKTAEAKSEQDWTRVECLHAHYKRWAFFNETNPVSLKTFEERLPPKFRALAEEVCGTRIYPRLILDPPEPEGDDDDDEIRSVAARSPFGKVRTVQTMTFCDGVLETGTVLDWVPPSKWESYEIARKSGDARDDTQAWLVVVWKDKRRYLDGTHVERL